MTLWNKLKILKILIQLIRNPQRTELIFTGVKIFSAAPDQAPARAVEQWVFAHEEFKAMREQSYMPQAPALEKLRNAPSGSFGQALCQHMDNHGLDFSLWPQPAGQRPLDYLSDRIYQDHDLWHALLGLGVSVEDELALQAFAIAQLRSPIALFLVAGGLFHLLYANPLRALAAFEKINEFYRLGQKARFLLGIKIHELFDKPLIEVRQICGLV